MKIFVRKFGLALIFVISGCGVPNSSEVIEISQSDLPIELKVQATTTTSSTTTVPESSSAKETGSTLAEVLSEPVELYFISANRVLATTQSIVSPATTSQVLAALIAGPPSGQDGSGLRSALPQNIDATIKVTKGVAAIDTTAQFLGELSPIDQRLAIAQLVLTFTRRPGVGQIIFSVDGEPVAVPRGRGDLAKPGSPVSFDDYSSLLIATTG